MKIKLPDPPCIGCICHPMCKTILKETDDYASVLKLGPLLKKCSLLSDYVYSKEMFVFLRMHRAEEIIKQKEIRDY